ncbi:hypothetical protein G3T14_20690 [Methylobacterium sp. BTF04]|uniref:hypothetical protein n=1 Tax=Methylobacterium sp. BTF04 TaxID=2708300 RepID=UPI0013D0B483|nr:hypothetical protein [Methylobacterium sp. BTF04]NEU14516.1 hypothetical protein [Methylobacterium sp. BTF04]
MIQRKDQASPEFLMTEQGNWAASAGPPRTPRLISIKDRARQRGHPWVVVGRNRARSEVRGLSVMNTYVASLTNAAVTRVAPTAASLDPLAESLRMLGLAVIGSATVVCLMWLVS